jgi:hypothetical protein
MMWFGHDEINAMLRFCAMNSCGDGIIGDGEHHYASFNQIQQIRDIL